jgi:peptidoglycan-N-acetylglucosamine deacetylase
MSTGAGLFPDGKRGAISLSFDDARLSQADVGFALLDRLGVRATFYVMPDLVGQRLPAWQQAVAVGHEIGNHTLSHPCTGNFPWSRQRALEDFTLDRMEQELTGANEAIRQLLGVTPTTFAYPCGQTYVGRGRSLHSYIPLVARHFIAGRGFRTEITNDPTFCDLAQLCAYESDGRTSAQLKTWVDAAIDQGRWLVLAGHEMATEGRQTTHLDALEELCNYCKERQDDVWIDTVANVASHLDRVRQQQTKIGEPSCSA